MKIYPAIDILDNRAVRLLYGDRNRVTDYGHPLDRALKWIEQGGEMLHIVDLNGAFDDSRVNDETLKELIKNITAPVQLGGGIKTFDKAKYYIEEVGASRVILGSVCVTNPDTVGELISKYNDKIICGIDAKDGKVCIKGWVESASISQIDLALKMKAYGAKSIIYTDISRDGALCGVNVEETIKLKNATDLEIIASGGMSSLKDIELLLKGGIDGAILGKSIYNGDIILKEAIAVGGLK